MGRKSRAGEQEKEGRRSLEKPEEGRETDAITRMVIKRRYKKRWISRLFLT